MKGEWGQRGIQGSGENERQLWQKEGNPQTGLQYRG